MLCWEPITTVSGIWVPAFAGTSGGSFAGHCVIAGLDPGIHPLRKRILRRVMDPRVKPAGDVVSTASAYYGCGFHSRARFWASASWAEGISPPTLSRVFPAGGRLPV